MFFRIILVALLAVSAHADVIKGKVVRVSDGDTIVVYTTAYM